MTLQELIELAILDAMGLLDEEERLSFELAFRSAAPAVQAQVRREQTRLSRIESILPDVSAPAGLRAAVVEAVRREIAATMTGASTAPALAITDSMVKATGVSRWWRAASLGLAAAAVVLGVTTFEWKHEFDGLQLRMRGDTLVDSMTRELGPAFVRNVLFSRDTHRVVLRPTDTASKSVASVWVNSESKAGMFFCQAMKSPPHRTLRIAVVDENNTIVRELATFESSGELKPVELKGLDGTERRFAVGTTNADGHFDSIVAEGDLSETSL